MNNYTKLWALLLAASTFTACQQDDIVPDVPDTPVGEYTKVRFTTGDDNTAKASTRAMWNDPEGSGNLFFSWEEWVYSVSVDKAGVVAAITDGKDYLGNYRTDNPSPEESLRYCSYLNIEPIAEGDGYSNRANFETLKYYGTEKVNKATYVHAVAPFLEGDVTSDITTLQLTAAMPGEFSQAASKDPSFLRDYMYMCGTAKMQNGSASIQFEHIPATFRFIINNKRPTGATIKSVTMSLDDAGDIGSTQLGLIAQPDDTGISKTYSSPCNSITTNITGDDAALTTDVTYIAYAMALPLGDEDGVYDIDAFNGKQIKFSIEAGNPDNEYLSFVLDADKLAGANPNGAYNWVGGKSYTIRMSLNDVLTFEGITVSDWTDGGYLNGGEAEEN